MSGGELRVSSGRGFLLVGSALVGLGFAGVAVAAFTAPLAAVAALVLVIFGVVTWRSHTMAIVELRAGFVRVRYGGPWPRKPTELPVAEVESVTVARELRRDERYAYRVYPVGLRGVKGSVRVIELRRPAPALRFALALAQALDASLSDTVGEEAVQRERHQLPESLSDRLRRQGAPPAFTLRPDECRIMTSSSAGITTFELSARGFRWFDTFLYALAVSMGIVTLLAILQTIEEWSKRSAAANATALVLFTLIILAMAAVVAVLVDRTAARHTLVVGPSELRCRRSSPVFGVRESAIGSTELLELYLVQDGAEVPGGAAWPTVIACGATTSFETGRFLQPAESSWLHGALLDALRGER